MSFTMASDINNPSMSRKRPPPHIHTKRMVRKHPLGGTFHNENEKKRGYLRLRKRKRNRDGGGIAVEDDCSHRDGGGSR